MVKITKYVEHKKDGRAFNVVHFFDPDTGEAGNCLMSLSYLKKIGKAVEDGKVLKIGYNRKKHTQFLYVK